MAQARRGQTVGGSAKCKGWWVARETRENVRVYVLELSVVSAPAGRVDETPGYARDEELVGDLELDDRVKHFFPGGKHRVEFLRLWHRTREAVKYKAM